MTKGFDEFCGCMVRADICGGCYLLSYGGESLSFLGLLIIYSAIKDRIRIAKPMIPIKNIESQKGS